MRSELLCAQFSADDGSSRGQRSPRAAALRRSTPVPARQWAESRAAWQGRGSLPTARPPRTPACRSGDHPARRGCRGECEKAVLRQSGTSMRSISSATWALPDGIEPTECSRLQTGTACGKSDRLSGIADRRVLCGYRMILRRGGSHGYRQLRPGSRGIWSFSPPESLRALAHRLSKRSISCRRISRLHGGRDSKDRIQIRLYGSIGDLVYHGTNWLFLTAS
jgi:hypothetical protein